MDDKAVKYMKTINELKEKYGVLLEEFKEKYITYQVSVENNGSNRYAKPALQDVERQLIQIQNSFFLTKNEIQVDITTMSKEIKIKDEEIDILTKKNEELKKKIIMVQDKKYGSEGKVYDEQVLYNQHNLGNWIILLLMFLVLGKTIKPYLSKINVDKIKEKGDSALAALK